jgi:ADP-ribosylglycohydrolase
MTLFTAEGLLRACHRWQGRGIASIPGIIRNAYLRWLSTQEDRPLEDWQRSGWLLGHSELHARRAPGNTCLGALRLDRLGTPADPLNDSKGCGGVMRVAPVGLAGVDPFELGCRAAALTHGHPTGFLAAGYFAELVWRVCRGEKLEGAARSALATLVREPGHEETTRAIERGIAAARTARRTPEEVERLGEGWVAEEALAIGLFCALAARDFGDGILLAVNHSGDSDSTGSIAGNLLGLVHGEAGIPARWLKRLELRHVIAEVADDLWRHFGEGSPAAAQGRCCADPDRYPGN